MQADETIISQEEERESQMHGDRGRGRRGGRMEGKDERREGKKSKYYSQIDDSQSHWKGGRVRQREAKRASRLATIHAVRRRMVSESEKEKERGCAATTHEEP